MPRTYPGGGGLGGCTGLSTNATPLDGGCFEVPSPSSLDRVIVPSAPITGCTVSTAFIDGSVMANWGTSMMGCASAPSAATCDTANEVCLETAPLPFEAKPCIYAAGTVSCPGAPYSASRPTLYMSTKTTCAALGCDCLVTPSDCDASIDYVGESPVCGPPNTSILPNVCTLFTADAATYVHVAVALPPVSCTVSNGQDAACTPNATVTETDPFTVCCMP